MSSSVWRVEQYRGQTQLDVVATQLADKGLKPAAARHVLQEWLEFFEAGPTPIRQLSLRSRVPQTLLDSLAGQTQLESLDVKWGNYADLAALSGLTNLTSLALGGASRVTDLSPLASLSQLRALTVDQAFLVKDLSPLSELVSLRELAYGNCYLGSEKNVDFSDFEWTRPLANLETLHMPGSRSINADFSPLLELPNLVYFRPPLRRAYRKQVFEYAAHSKAFAGLAKEYEDYDAWCARTAHT